MAIKGLRKGSYRPVCLACAYLTCPRANNNKTLSEHSRFAVMLSTRVKKKERKRRPELESDVHLVYDLGKL